MTTPERRIVDEAIAWYRSRHADDPGSELDPLRRAIGAYLLAQEPPGPRTDQARPMTWGTVPAGWYVQTSRGDWYEVSGTVLYEDGRQLVGMLIAGKRHTFSRDPQGPVTACPGPPNATDAAIEALGFPQILGDGV